MGPDGQQGAQDVGRHGGVVGTPTVAAFLVGPEGQAAPDDGAAFQGLGQSVRVGRVPGLGQGEAQGRLPVGVQMVALRVEFLQRLLRRPSGRASASVSSQSARRLSSCSPPISRFSASVPRKMRWSSTRYPRPACLQQAEQDVGRHVAVGLVELPPVPAAVPVLVAVQLLQAEIDLLGERGRGQTVRAALLQGLGHGDVGQERTHGLLGAAVGVGRQEVQGREQRRGQRRREGKRDGGIRRQRAQVEFVLCRGVRQSRGGRRDHLQAGHEGGQGRLGGVLRPRPAVRRDGEADGGRPGRTHPARPSPPLPVREGLSETSPALPSLTGEGAGRRGSAPSPASPAAPARPPRAAPCASPRPSASPRAARW